MGKLVALMVALAACGVDEMPAPPVLRPVMPVAVDPCDQLKPDQGCCAELLGCAPATAACAPVPGECPDFVCWLDDGTFERAHQGC